MPTAAADHPFLGRPHRTLLALSIPVLLSLVAEPLTGLADTAFVARLGMAPLAALGVATILLSSVFWIFNFLGIGTQTEVARAFGAARRDDARDITSLALVLSLLCGALLIAVGEILLRPVVVWMGARDTVHDGAVTYLRIRLLAAPAVLITVASFGALRGLQDMKTPLWIALAINALNIVLDAVLIFGLGPVPALGLAGAAWATVGSQWLGAGWAVAAVGRRLGFARRLRAGDASQLLVVGRDLMLRTGLLTAFLVIATRSATRIGTDAGAAHQAIRQVWFFTALLLDAFAATAQSLVGYFFGARHREQARRVAAVACAWSIGTGVVLAVAMLVTTVPVQELLVPAEARQAFRPAWWLAALFMPLSALCFATDGLHWGSGDFAYLRNAMVVATGLGVLGIWLLDESAEGAFALLWLVSGGWITVRAALGAVRIWPGFGASPFALGREPTAVTGPEGSCRSSPPGRGRWLRRAGWLGAGVALLLGAFSLGCTSTVVPPVDPQDPVTVFLLRDARHRGLVLPGIDGAYVEYGYGDWDWYARNRDRWYHVFDTVLWPTQGTLGRRVLGERDPARVPLRYPWAEVEPLLVSAASVRRLAEDLAGQYRAGVGEEQYNARYGLHFVPHEDGFWFPHLCADAVATWLRQLDCRVSRSPIRLDLELADDG